MLLLGIDGGREACVRPNVVALRRGPFLAVAWSGWFGTAEGSDSTRPTRPSVPDSLPLPAPADCPECGGRLRLLATINDPAVIKKILGHVGLPTEAPTPIPAQLAGSGIEIPADWITA